MRCYSPKRNIARYKIMSSTLFRWDDVTVVDGNGRGRDDKVKKII